MVLSYPHYFVLVKFNFFSLLSPSHFNFFSLLIFFFFFDKKLPFQPLKFLGTRVSPSVSSFFSHLKNGCYCSSSKYACPPSFDHLAADTPQPTTAPTGFFPAAVRCVRHSGRLVKPQGPTHSQYSRASPIFILSRGRGILKHKHNYNCTRSHNLSHGITAFCAGH